MIIALLQAATEGIDLAVLASFAGVTAAVLATVGLLKTYVPTGWFGGRRTRLISAVLGIGFGLLGTAIYGDGVATGAGAALLVGYWVVAVLNGALAGAAASGTFDLGSAVRNGS